MDDKKIEFAESVADYVETNFAYDNFNKRDAVISAINMLLNDIGAAQRYLEAIGVTIDLYNYDFGKKRKRIKIVNDPETMLDMMNNRCRVDISSDELRGAETSRDPDHFTGKEASEVSNDCVFCQIIAGIAPGTIVREWPEALAFVPLNPVTSGHLLVVPKVHVKDALSNPAVTAMVMGAASSLAGETTEQCNIITSAGSAATQTVFHFHVHIVPRMEGDGLALPWTVS